MWTGKITGNLERSSQYHRQLSGQDFIDLKQQTEALVIYIAQVLNDSRFRLKFMVLDATLNNISAISWQSILLVQETGVPGKPPTCHKSLANFIT